MTKNTTCRGSLAGDAEKAKLRSIVNEDTVAMAKKLFSIDR